MYLRDLGRTEVGGFGISSAGDPLLIDEISLVQQSCTIVSVHFDDASVADFFDAQVDEGRRPEEFARLWIHTHPGDSPEPSSVDEETFRRVFGSSAWAVMFILARGGNSYARLRFNVGPGGSLRIPVDVDYTQAFSAADHDAWELEYRQNVVSVEGFTPDDFDWWGPLDAGRPSRRSKTASSKEAELAVVPEAPPRGLAHALEI